MGAKSMKPAPVTHQDIQELIRGIAMFVDDYAKPLKQEIDELKGRIAELEAGGIRYCGIYQRASAYKRGSVVTHQGSMFVAVVDVGPNEVPLLSQSWQLSAKKGRDGRDGDRN